MMTQLPVADAEQSRPGRPRSEQAERAIIEATLNLLAEVGVAAMSIEQIAAAAGVGKATIYRRWPNKEALIVDAVLLTKPPLPELPGRSVRGDLLVVGEAMRHSHNLERDRKLLACMMGEAQRHPELARRVEAEVFEPRREVIRQVLRRGVASGELRADLDLDLMLLMLTGPLLQGITMSARRGEVVSADFAEKLVDIALDGLRPRSA